MKWNFCLRKETFARVQNLFNEPSTSSRNDDCYILIGIRENFSQIVGNHLIICITPPNLKLCWLEVSGIQLV